MPSRMPVELDSVRIDAEDVGAPPVEIGVEVDRDVVAVEDLIAGSQAGADLSRPAILATDAEVRGADRRSARAPRSTPRNGALAAGRSGGSPRSAERSTTPARRGAPSTRIAPSTRDADTRGRSARAGGASITDVHAGTKIVRSTTRDMTTGSTLFPRKGDGAVSSTRTAGASGGFGQGPVKNGVPRGA